MNKFVLEDEYVQMVSKVKLEKIVMVRWKDE